MTTQKGPTAEDRAKVVRVTLAGIAGGLELGKIAAHLVPLHPKQHLSQRGPARTGRRRHRGKWCDPAAVPRV